MWREDESWYRRRAWSDIWCFTVSSLITHNKVPRWWRGAGGEDWKGLGDTCGNTVLAAQLLNLKLFWKINSINWEKRPKMIPKFKKKKKQSLTKIIAIKCSSLGKTVRKISWFLRKVINSQDIWSQGDLNNNHVETFRKSLESKTESYYTWHSYGT